jgi:hypothetical protein
MKPVRSPCHRSPVRRHGFSEASEHGIGTLLGGVLEEERVARMPNIELAALDEAHAVDVSVANTHYSECLAPTLRTNDPARLSALDQWQVVISDKLDDEAFEWTPSVDLAILRVRLDVVAGSDAVSIEADQHIPSLLHEGIPERRFGPGVHGVSERCRHAGGVRVGPGVPSRTIDTSRAIRASRSSQNDTM